MRPAAGRDRGRLRRLRRARRPGPALARGARPGWRRGGGAAATSSTTQTKIGSAPVTLSRTGYTGDLGFEITVEADHALDVLDAVLEAGQGRTGIRPFGEEALMMLRIEAGLPLIDVEWPQQPAGLHRRTTGSRPRSSAWAGCCAACDDDRAFVGRDAIRRELADGTSRWASVGIVVDWQHWDQPAPRRRPAARPKDEHPLGTSRCCTSARGAQVGYATSFMYSPVLQRHIGLARVRPALRRARHRGTPRGRRSTTTTPRCGPHREAPAVQPQARKTA